MPKSIIFADVLKANAKPTMLLAFGVDLNAIVFVFFLPLLCGFALWCSASMEVWVSTGCVNRFWVRVFGVQRSV